ncbi:MAG: PAC2 family protein [Phycisphaerales bacterium]
MAEFEELRNPWLVAVWPGMGNVAINAGGYLMEQLGATLVNEMAARDFFEVQHIDVKNGLSTATRQPRSLFFEWRNPEGDHDLLLFLGEAQPSARGYEYCHKLLDYALSRGVRRVFTFAAMATQLHPTSEPRVFGVATDNDTLIELRDYEVEILKEGQISGLNGVLLAAGADRGLSGICLLGELPFFAVGVPNPKASQAVLEIFTKMAGASIDFAPIAQQSEAMEQHLLGLLEKLKEAARQQAEADEESEFETTEFSSSNDDDDEDDEDSDGAEIDEMTRRRIEALFNEAENDRDKAFQLKEELDRLGVFKKYEDRFLDLFRKAE